MQEDHSKIYTKMFGSPIMTENISIQGVKGSAKVTIYDGMAIGTTSDGKQVQLEYPKLSVVKGSKELSDELMTYLPDIKEVEEITAVQVMQTFATVFVDGVEVKK